MKHSQIQPGMKVVPHKKSDTRYRDFDNSVVLRFARKKGQPYLFVSGWDAKENVWLLNDYYREDMEPTGDFFHASDFELYEEEKKDA